MNHTYRSIWNEATHSWVAVAEIVCARGKRSGGIVGQVVVPTLPRWRALSLAVMLALIGQPTWAIDVNTLPTGGQVVAGSAAINQAGNVLNITQSTARAAIDWQSFNVGSAATVNFIQPSSSSVTLNRVLSNDASQIYGKLNANGQVFFTNPNGMLFARGAQINVGGIVASTLNISNADFMAGNYTFANPGGGILKNEGRINASGSAVLVGNQIENTGEIYATTIALASGNRVAVDLTGDGLIRARVEDPALSSQINNSGTLDGTLAVAMTAGQAKNVLDSVVNNKGVIRATGLNMVNGEIVLQGGMVENTGTITASGPQGGGTIKLLGDMEGGVVKVAGTLDASAPTAGNGGFVDTSAATVQVQEGARVTTTASQGKTGSWLIDPTDFYIAATDPNNGSSYISNTTLATNLAGGDITIQTLSTGGGNGDIFVNDGVSWTSGYRLTLNAIRDINVNALIKSGTYGVGVSVGNAGDVTLNAGRNILLGVTGTAIDASIGAGGNGTTTGRGGDVSLFAGGAITGASSDIWTKVEKYQPGSTGSRGGHISLTASNGGISIRDLKTFTYQNDSGGTIGNAGNVTVTASGNIAVGVIDAGANGGFNDWGGTTTIGTAGNVTLTAGGSVTLNGNLNASVGVGSYATTWGNGGKVKLRADSQGACLTGGTGCGTVILGVHTIGAFGYDNGQIDIYYNPTAYSTPTDYDYNITEGYLTAWMLVNDVGVASGGLRGLQAMSTNLAGNYALGRDVGASATSSWNAGSGFAPIGNATTRFTGNFDGQGRTISNLTINRPATENIGLFGATFGGEIRNVGLIDASIAGLNNVGTLIGYNEQGTVTNSYATGTLTATGSYIGGLIGSSKGPISNSYADVAVSGTGAFVGGLLGVNDNSTLSNSYATGNVAGADIVGGLVGVNWTGTLSNSYATGDVHASGLAGFHSRAGGLVGQNYASGVITTSYAKGRVTGVDNAYVGGAVGWTDNTSSTTYTYWNSSTNPQGVGTGAVSGATIGTLGVGSAGQSSANLMMASTYSGWTNFNTDWWISDGNTTPMLRSEYSTTITNAHQLQLMAMNLSASYTLARDIDASKTAGTGDVWGVAGFKQLGNATTSTYFSGTLDGLGHTISNLVVNRRGENETGLFGRATTGAVIKNLGLVNAFSSGDFSVGLMVGDLGAGTISNSYATGTVVGVYGNVGGLAGRSSGTISNSYADVDVTGGWQVGGLVGESASGSNITNTYALSNVRGINTSSGWAGGLVGVNSGGSLSLSYASGLVTSNTTNGAGGLVGSRTSGTVTNSYWNSSVNSVAVASGVLGSGVAGITEANAFTGSSYAALDANTWWMAEGATRPFLRTEWSTSIGNLHQLQLMAMNLSANYSLKNSIDASAASGAVTGGMWNTRGFSPVGNGSSNFTGSLDGQNYVIKNLKIDGSLLASVGLFGETGAASVIKNLGISNAVITVGNASGASAENIGILTGVNRGSVFNAFSSGLVTINGSSSWIASGGLVGGNYGAISDSYSTANVTANGVHSFSLGGLVGLNGTDGAIDRSYATGNVTGSNATSSSEIGGLVGAQIGGSLEESYSTGAVTGSGNASDTTLGGLIGLSSGLVSNVYSTSPVTASASVTLPWDSVIAGGLIGNNAAGSISYGYATGLVTLTLSGGATGTAGGLFGSNSGTVTTVFWDSSVNPNAVGSGSTSGMLALTNATAFTQNQYSGLDFSQKWWMAEGSSRPLLRSEWRQNVGNLHQLQLMGMNLSAAYTLVNNIDASPTVGGGSSLWSSAGFAPIGSATDALDNTGTLATGFAGSFNGQGYVIENLNINLPSQVAVGLFGYTRVNASISSLGLLGGSITAKDNVGALVGTNFGVISYSYATTNVTQSLNGLYGRVGGLVGRNTLATASISNSYATGTVTTTTGVAGGLVGANDNGVITKTYSTGAVVAANGLPDVGGLVGYGSDVTSSYWDIDSSGRSVSAGGAGVQGVRSVTSTINAFNQASYAGFDFSTDWWIAEGATRPFLRAEWKSEVSNLHQLQLMAMKPAESYVLTKDLNAAAASGAVTGAMWASSGFSPIGLTTPTSVNSFYLPTSTALAFSGRFDGQNHTISNLTINLPTTSGVGLFGYLYNADVRNLTLAGGSVTGKNYVGALAGVNQAYSTLITSKTSTVDSVTSSVSVTSAVTDATGAFAGGLVGLNDASYDAAPGSYFLTRVNAVISNSSSSGAVSGQSHNVGGLVGLNHARSIDPFVYATISNGFATGTVTQSGMMGWVGGLVGKNYASAPKGVVQITNSYAKGAVTASTSSMYVGGLAGSNEGSNGKAYISSSYATGNVTGDIFIGGLIGLNTGGTYVTKSYASGTVLASGVNLNGNYWTGGSYAGGLIGGNSGDLASVQDSYAIGNVTGSVYVGGLIGRITAYGSAASLINRTYATGVVTGSSNVSGLVGQVESWTSTASVLPVANSFYSTTTNPTRAPFNGNGVAGSQIAGKVYGMSEIDLSTAANFTSATTANGNISPSWDLSTVWNIDAGSSTPYLRGLTRPPMTCTVGTICFDNSAGDWSWSNALNWNLDRLPGSSDVVYLGLTGTNTISYAGASTEYSIQSLQTTANNKFNLSSGWVNLSNSSGTSSLLGGLQMADGSKLTTLGTLEITQPTGTMTLANVSAGTLKLTAQGVVSQYSGAVLEAYNLLLLGNSASYTLNNLGNQILSLAANTGALNVRSAHANALTITSVAGTSGITSTGAVTLSANGVTVNQAINTNGNHLTIGGGADPLTGYAVGGVYLGANVATGAGNVSIRGQKSNGTGVQFGAGTLSVTSGSVYVNGETSAVSVGGSGGVVFSGDGVRLSTASGNVVIDGTATAASHQAYGIMMHSGAPVIETTGAGSLTLNGSHLKTNNPSYNLGIGIHNGTIRSTAATNGGAINLNGSSLGDTGILIRSNQGPITISSVSGPINVTASSGPAVGIEMGHDYSLAQINAGSGALTLTADKMTLGATAQILGTGALTIKPYTAGATIGLGSGSGTLQLDAYEWGTLKNGFSSITLGSNSAGAIDVAGSTTYNDPLTLKTAGSINVNTGAMLTGTSGQSAHLTLWANSAAAGNGASGSGAIYIRDGASIQTNGGDITFGGGANPLTGYAVGTTVNSGTGISDYLGMGVYVGTGSSVLSSGGNITINGAGLHSGNNGGYIYGGVDFNGSTVNSGAGKIFVRALGQGTNGNTQALYGSATAKLLSSNTATDAIQVDATYDGSSPLYQIALNYAGTIAATNGGGISLVGNSNFCSSSVTLCSGIWMGNGMSVLANTGPISITGLSSVNAANKGMNFANANVYIGAKAGSEVSSSSSDITLIADTIQFTGLPSILSTGSLTIRPNTAGSTIGIAGGTGTLQLPSTFLTSIAGSGFTNLTFGSATTGAITMGTATLPGNFKLWAGYQNSAVNLNGDINWSSGTFTVGAGGDININANLLGTGTTKLGLGYGLSQPRLSNTASYVLQPGKAITLPAGPNFSILHTDNWESIYTVITSLGAANSTTGSDLQGIEGNLSGRYVLGADIVASGFAFRPIGSYASGTAIPFTGELHGLGHTVSGLTVSSNASTNSRDAGLFSTLSNAVLRDLTLSNVSVTGVGEYTWTGALAGSALSQTKIVNVFVTGASTVSNTSVGSWYTGGLVGWNGGLIAGSLFNGSVSGSDYVGGLVGSNAGTLYSVTSSGTVSGHYYVGGLVGRNSGAINSGNSRAAVTGYAGSTGALYGVLGTGYMLADNSVGAGAVTTVPVPTQAPTVAPTAPAVQQVANTVSSVLASVTMPVVTVTPTVTTPTVTSPSSGSLSTPSTASTTTSATTSNTNSSSSGSSSSSSSASSNASGTTNSASLSSNSDEAETSQPASSSQTSSTTQGNKPDNKSSPAPATVQTVNVAGTTVQKPAEQMINVPTSKGSTLVCK